MSRRRGCLKPIQSAERDSYFREAANCDDDARQADVKNAKTKSERNQRREVLRHIGGGRAEKKRGRRKKSESPRRKGGREGGTHKPTSGSVKWNE